MASFFEWINELLGVRSASELVFHPVFIGFCVVAFVASILLHMKYFALAIAALMGGALIFQYLYPANTADLVALMKFLAAMGGLALLLIYIGFVRD